MTTKTESDDDSYIIILGSSPGNSMDLEKCNGAIGTMKEELLDKSQIEDAMKDLSTEANMAFKAQFSLADSPSPASMMVASTIITDDRSTEELQKRFGELLDENVVLKETLKQNNDSMKEQFMLIASCQEDMLKTHRLHKEKFDETRELVEKLRQENKQLKLDLSRIADGDVAVNNETGESKPGESSVVEFVTSPDEDTIDKLTAQLELVEKQRRQLIVDNEKLSWQKESLENIIDSTSKERDDAKEKLKNIELQLSNKENDHSQELQKLHFIINDLQSKLKSSSSNVSPEQMAKREAYVQQLEGKITYFQNELKKAQIKILDLENIKLEFTQYKSRTAETNKMYKEQIQDLNNRIKEIQKTVFQPVRLSLSPEQAARSQYAAHVAHVKLYDRTLKHLAEYFNALTDGAVDSQAAAASAAAALRAGAGGAGAGAEQVAALQRQLRAHHDAALTNVAQVRGALSIFEGIFKDYNELLKKSVTMTETKPQSQSVEQLTAALLARGRELQALETQLATLTLQKEETDLLKAQVDLYKSDFEAERESRAKMASEKENLMTDLRSAQKKIQELTTQLEEIRILSPGMHKSITAKRRPVARAPPAAAAAAAPAPANTAFTCPKCMRFSSDDYKKMEDHFDFCLDDF